MVEFALILVPLALILTGVLQFGVIFSAQVGITNAVREAVREASAIPISASSNASSAAQAVYTNLTSATGLLVTYGSSYYPSGLVTGSGQPSTANPHTSVCYYSYLDATSTLANPVYSVMARVEVQYNHPLFIPLISSILGGNVLRIGTVEEIRVANPPLATNGGIGDSTSMTCYP